MEKDYLEELLSNKKFEEIKTIIKDMNEYDIASLIEELPEDMIIKAFRLLPKEVATEVFVNMDEEIQRNLITSLTKAESKNIIEDMFTDDAVDLFEEMPPIMVKSLLSGVDKETRNNINKLLKYPENSAGSLMTTEYIDFNSNLSIKNALEKIRKDKEEKVSYENFFVTDNKDKLLGIVSVKDLLTNIEDTKLEDIMEECPHPIHTLTDQEEVANIFQDYDYSSLPVVDSDERLVGIITIDDIVDIIEEEATEDMEKMAAILPTEKSYDKITVFETFKARIPWLLLLMVSATFTGKIIQGFEKQLAAYTVLTAFIPMLMDTGGNAGGQASVSIIRAISLNDIEFSDIFKVIFKEFRIALLCSFTLAICNFFKLIFIDHINLTVSLVVCITLCATITIAKLIGCSLPMIAKKIGFDPAVMASPFITTIVDACSLLIYFNIATLILKI